MSDNVTRFPMGNGGASLGWPAKKFAVEVEGDGLPTDHEKLLLSVELREEDYGSAVKGCVAVSSEIKEF